MTDYIKLPRSALTDEILSDEKLCRLYLNLLARADENGCAEISVRGFARECKLSYQTMRTLLNRLLATQVLTQISTQKITRLSFCDTVIKSNSPTRKLTLKSTQVSAQKPTAKFIPPTDEEVGRYVAEKGYHFDPAQFVPFYQSKGWMIGKNPMKDWRAACRTWEIEWKKKHGDKYYNQLNNGTTANPHSRNARVDREMESPAEFEARKAQRMAAIAEAVLRNNAGTLYQ